MWCGGRCHPSSLAVILVNALSYLVKIVYLMHVSDGLTERARVSSQLITRKVIVIIISDVKINLILNILSRALDIF